MSISFFLSFCLSWDNVDCTRAFFTLAHLEIDLLAFVKIRITFCFDFGVMNEHILTTAVRDDKPETLTAIEPLYYTCTHYNTPGPFI